MKHEEAQKYHCPQSIGREKQTTCYGSDCAAWRWAEPKWGSREQRRGYCGLAGDLKFPLNPDHEK